MNMTRPKTAFTIVELLVALVVTSVILSAVATLAFAMSTAARVAEETAYTQTSVRTVGLQLGDLIRSSLMICAQVDDDVDGVKDLVVWTRDDDDANVIDVNEIVYIECDGSNLYLRRFDTQENPTVFTALGLSEGESLLTALAQSSTQATLVQHYASDRIPLLQGCSHIQFELNPTPPRTRRLTISFDLAEDGGVHHYEIEAGLLGSAEYLLNSDATDLVVSDDD
jgi:type II secretory pathway pseudopilin PulG